MTTGKGLGNHVTDMWKEPGKLEIDPTGKLTLLLQEGLGDGYSQNLN